MRVMASASCLLLRIFSVLFLFHFHACAIHVATFKGFLLDMGHQRVPLFLDQL